MTAALLYPLDFIPYPPVIVYLFDSGRAWYGPTGLPVPTQGSTTRPLCTDLAINAFMYQSSQTIFNKVNHDLKRFIYFTKLKRLSL